MSARGTRVQRIESEMLQILSLHLQQRMGEPLPCYASITAVETGADLRNAKVYFRLVGEGEAIAEAKKILDAERSKFQKDIAKELKVKFCPVLHFEYGVAAGHDPVDELLQNLRKPRNHFED